MTALAAHVEGTVDRLDPHELRRVRALVLEALADAYLDNEPAEQLQPLCDLARRLDRKLGIRRDPTPTLARRAMLAADRRPYVGA